MSSCLIKHYLKKKWAPADDPNCLSLATIFIEDSANGPERGVGRWADFTDLRLLALGIFDQWDARRRRVVRRGLIARPDMIFESFELGFELNYERHSGIQIFRSGGPFYSMCDGSHADRSHLCRGDAYGAR